MYCTHIKFEVIQTLRFAHKNCMYFKFKCLLFSLLIATSFAVAQNNSLDPVTITSSLLGKQQSQTGRNVIIVDKEQLLKQPIQSIDDLLKYLPGVEVHQRGAFGAQADISIRGSTYQQVLIIIDGIRLNDPLTGHFNGYIPIHITEIEKIEVLYGGSSAIYGTEAVGGVINVITKSFSTLTAPQKTHFQAQSFFGDNGLYNNSIGGLVNTKNGAIAGGVSILNTSGQPMRGTNGFVNNFNTSLSYSSRITKKLTVALRGAFDSRSFSAQNFYTNFKSDTAVERVNTFWSHIQLSYALKKSKIIFDAGYKSVNDSFRFNPASTANINESSLFQSQLQYQYNLSHQHSFTAGGQFIQKNIISNDRGNHNIPQGAAFFVWQSQIGEHLFLNPSVRYDNSQAFGGYVVAQLNASYRLKKTAFRFSVGNTIRDADFTERFNNYGKALVSSGTIGNPNLKTEKAINYELGTDYFINNRIKLTATIFQRQQSNLIDFVPTAYANMPRRDNLLPTGSYSLASNISQLTTTGLEFNIHYNHQWKNQSLYALAGVLWLDNSNADEIALKSFYIQSQAKFIYNFNVQYTYKHLTIAVNGIYKIRNLMQTSTAAFVAQQIQPENYFVANVRLSYTLPVHSLTGVIQINNFYDKSYSDLLGSIMPRRWVSGGLQIKF
jgi:vitamin B12 transporter